MPRATIDATFKEMLTAADSHDALVGIEHRDLPTLEPPHHEVKAIAERIVAEVNRPSPREDRMSMRQGWMVAGRHFAKTSTERGGTRHFIDGKPTTKQDWRKEYDKAKSSEAIAAWRMQGARLPHEPGAA